MRNPLLPISLIKGFLIGRNLKKTPATHRSAGDSSKRWFPPVSLQNYYYTLATEKTPVSVGRHRADDRAHDHCLRVATIK